MKKIKPGLVLSIFAVMSLAACGPKPTTSIPSSRTTSYSGDEYKAYKMCGENGTCSFPTRNESGSKVTITTTPSEGYITDEVFVVGRTSGDRCHVTKEQDNKYSFTMPEEEVNVNVSFCKPEPYHEYAKTPKTQEMEDLGYKNGIGDESFRKGLTCRKKLNGGDYTFKNPVTIYDWTVKPTPIWGITQWMSQSLVDPDTPNYYKNVTGTKGIVRDKETGYAKSLEFDTANGDFTMICDCTKEYANDEQEVSPYYGGKWWVHYLMEQNLPKAIKLSELKDLVMTLDYELTEYSVGNIFKGAADCAQFEWYVSIQDLKSSSNTYEWFGFDLWDNRYPGEVSDEYKKGEYGSGVRICRPHSEWYLSDTKGKRPTNTPSGTKFHLNMVDCLKYIKDDFDANHGEGQYWADANWEDMAIVSTNIGFEIHNHYRAGFKISNMGIYYK